MTEKKLAEKLAQQYRAKTNLTAIQNYELLLAALREMQSACVKVAQASCGCDNHDCDALRCIVAHEIAENIGRL